MKQSKTDKTMAHEKEILQKLTDEFNFVGDEKISGHTALRVVQKIFDDFLSTLPKEEESRDWLDEIDNY
jgi:hypothetical protein